MAKITVKKIGQQARSVDIDRRTTQGTSEDNIPFQKAEGFDRSKLYENGKLKEGYEVEYYEGSNKVKRIYKTEINYVKDYIAQKNKGATEYKIERNKTGTYTPEEYMFDKEGRLDEHRIYKTYDIRNRSRTGSSGNKHEEIKQGIYTKYVTKYDDSGFKTQSLIYDERTQSKKYGSEKVYLRNQENYSSGQLTYQEKERYRSDGSTVGSKTDYIKGTSKDTSSDGKSDMVKVGNRYISTQQLGRQRDKGVISNREYLEATGQQVQAPDIDPQTGYRYTKAEKDAYVKDVKRQIDEGKPLNRIERPTVIQKRKTLSTLEPERLSPSAATQLGPTRELAEEKYGLSDDVKQDIKAAQFKGAYSGPSMEYVGKDSEFELKVSRFGAEVVADATTSIATGLATTQKAGGLGTFIAGPVTGYTFLKETFWGDNKREAELKSKVAANQPIELSRDKPIVIDGSVEQTLASIDVATGQANPILYTKASLRDFEKDASDLTKQGGLLRETETDISKRQIKEVNEFQSAYSTYQSRPTKKNFQNALKEYEDVEAIDLEIGDFQSKVKSFQSSLSSFKYDLGLMQTSAYDRQQAGLLPTKTYTPGVVENIAFGISASSDRIKDSDYTYKEFEKTGQGFKKIGYGLEQVGANIKNDKSFSSSPIRYTTGSFFETGGRRVQKGGQYIIDKPGEATALVTAVVGTAALATVSAPVGLGFIKAGTVAIASGQVMRVTTRDLGEDTVYGFTSKQNKSDIRKGMRNELRSFVIAEQSSVAQRGKIVGWAAENVPFSELIPGISDKSTYRQQSEDYYTQQGYTGAELKRKVDLATNLRTAKSVEIGARTIAVEVVSELSGGPLKTALTRSTVPKLVKDRLAYTAARLPTYAAVGFSEGLTGSLVVQDKFYINKYDYGSAERAGKIGAVSAAVVGGVLDYTSVSGGLKGTVDVKDYQKALKPKKLIQDVKSGKVTIEFAASSDDLINVPMIKKDVNEVLGIGYSGVARKTQFGTKAWAYIADLPEYPGDLIASGIEKITGLSNIVRPARITTFGFGSSSTSQSQAANQAKDVTGKVKVENVNVGSPSKSNVKNPIQTAQQSPLSNFIKQSSPVQIKTTGTMSRVQAVSLSNVGSPMLQKSSTQLQTNVPLTQMSNIGTPIEQTTDTRISIFQSTNVPQTIPLKQQSPININLNVEENVPVQTTNTIFTPSLFLPIFGWGDGWGPKSKKKKKKEKYQRSFTAKTFGIKTKAQAQAMFGENILIEEKGKKKYSLFGLRI